MSNVYHILIIVRVDIHPIYISNSPSALYLISMFDQTFSCCWLKRATQHIFTKLDIMIRTRLATSFKSLPVLLSTKPQWKTTFEKVQIQIRYWSEIRMYILNVLFGITLMPFKNASKKLARTHYINIWRQREFGKYLSFFKVNYLTYLNLCHRR